MSYLQYNRDTPWSWTSLLHLTQNMTQAKLLLHWFNDLSRRLQPGDVHSITNVASKYGQQAFANEILNLSSSAQSLKVMIELLDLIKVEGNEECESLMSS